MKILVVILSWPERFEMKILIKRVSGEKIDFSQNFDSPEEFQGCGGGFFYIVEGTLGKLVELCFVEFGQLIVKHNWYGDAKQMILIYDDYFE